MVTSLSSRGWRITSRTPLLNSGNSSKNKTPLCDNEISLIHGRKVNKWLNEAGLNRKEVSIDEMISIEPSLNLENFVGGFYTDSDMSGDIHKFTMLLAEACMNKGVTFYYETEIKKINHNKKQPIISFSKK